MQVATQLSPLNALYSIDGSYAPKVGAPREFLSEAGFTVHRAEVEIAWLIGMSELGLPELPPFSADARALLHGLVQGFSEQDSERIKQIEKITKHEVKAEEY